MAAGASCTAKGRPGGAGAAGVPVRGGVFQAGASAGGEAPLLMRLCLLYSSN